MSSKSLIRTLYVSTRAVRTVVQDASRARNIAAILVKYGFGALIDSRRRRGEAEAPQDLATRAVLMLEELGPTFVKFGQILSTRPDLIPERLADRLQALQDHVAAVPIEAVEQTIIDSLGEPPDRLFKTFDRVPIASASIAQVHAATTHDGRDVVVKVQRPNLRATITADLSLMNFLAGRVLDVYPEAAYFDLPGMVEEFQKSLLRELDFDVERQSIQRFRENFKDKPYIHIPEVFTALSSSTVITMDRIRGQKLTRLSPDIDTQEVARLYLDAAYQMLFEDGFFHGDLHPGNVFLEDGGRLGIIDFGMVGRLSRSMRERVVDIIFSVLRGDLEGVARIWYSIGRPLKQVDYGSFEADVVEILEMHAVGKPLDQIDMGAFLRELAQGAMRHGIRLPSDFTMMFKAMVTTEGLAKQVAKGINPVEAAQPYIETVIKERYSMDRIKQVAFSELVHLTEVGRELPARVERLLTQAEAGELEMRLRHDAFEDVSVRMVRAFNRTAVSIVVAAGLLAGALTVESHVGPVLFGFPVLSLTCFAISVLGIIWLGVGVLKGR